MATPDASLLDVNDLRVEIATERGTVVASDDVSYGLRPGEVVALVGESGCGKTITALSTIRLLPPGARITAGEILFRGEDLATAPEGRLREVRGGEIGYVAQDATAALNPVLRVGAQIVETVRAHTEMSKSAARRHARELLASVGIPDPEARLDAFPSELSGGMRQRVAIAIALSCNPALIIADEPTTALDATVQAQVAELMRELADQRGVAILLISHDVGLVASVADRMMVMYAARIAERGDATDVSRAPAHPYTAALLACAPRIRGERRDRFPLTMPGRPPDLHDPPAGCRFHPRCRYARDRCREEEPRIGLGSVACWYPLADSSAACPVVEVKSV